MKQKKRRLYIMRISDGDYRDKTKIGFRGLSPERIDSGGDFLYNRRCVFLIKCHKYEELKD